MRLFEYVDPIRPTVMLKNTNMTTIQATFYVSVVLLLYKNSAN